MSQQAGVAPAHARDRVDAEQRCVLGVEVAGEGRGGPDRQDGLQRVLAAAGGDVLGELGGGRVLEQVPDGDGHVPHRPDPADQAGGEQGVSAELEEVVVDGDRADAQGGREQSAEDFLGRGARCPAAARDGRRLRQGLAVQLAVDRHRQGVQRDERGRDHVLGQRGRRVPPQVRNVDLAALGRDHVGDQALVAGPVLTDDHGGLGERRVAQQRRLDLAGLDPEAAQFELLVGAAQVLQVAVVVPAGQVTGAVHPATGRAVRAGDEAVRAEPGLPDVAVGQPVPAHVQLAGHARRQQSQVPVQDVRVLARDRPADRDGRCRGARGQDVGGGEAHALGRAVAVDQEQVGVSSKGTRGVGGGGRLAGRHGLGEVGEDPGVLVQHVVEQARRHLKAGHPVALDQLRDLVRVGVLARLEDADPAEQQRAEHLQREGVPGDRRALQEDLLRPEAEVVGPEEGGRERPVRGGDALRQAGRAGGEHHAGDALRVPAGLHGRARQCADRHRVGRQVDQGAGGRQAHQVALGDQGRRGGLAEHGGQAVGRELRVEQGVAGARLQHRQQRGDQLRRAL